MISQLAITALEWRQYGYSPFPLLKSSKRPALKWSLYSEVPPAVPDLLRWFKYNYNIGVVCGGKNNLTVVDFDTQQGYYEALLRVSPELCGIINKTYKVKTGRGVHLYFKVQTRSRKNVEKKIDVKGAGGYVVAAPSLHSCGTHYTAMPGSSIANIQEITREQLYELALLSDEEEVVAPYDIDRKAVFDIEPDQFGFVDDFDYVLQRVPILRVALHLTPLYQKNERYFLGKCPIHNDHDPSFWVDTRLGIAKCFSTACQLNDKAVNVIGLWALAHNISYPEAMQDLMRFI